MVTALAWSPDGKGVLTGAEDHLLRLWDPETGAEVRRFKGHSGWITSVAFSPDGKRIASGSWDRTLRIWDAVSGALLQTCEGHKGYVTTVCWSPDGTQVLSGSWDGTLRIWDPGSGKELMQFGDPRGLAEQADPGQEDLQGPKVRYKAMVTSASWSPDGAGIVSGDNGNLVLVWDVAKGEPVAAVQGHASAVLAVAWSPDGKRFVSASEDATALVWKR